MFEEYQTALLVDVETRMNVETSKIATERAIKENRKRNFTEAQAQLAVAIQKRQALNVQSFAHKCGCYRLLGSI